MSKNKKKEYDFSEEIDSSINGFSVGAAFMFTGLFIWFTGLFNNRIIEMIVTVLLLIIGIFGTFLEVDKANNHNNIKGFGDLGLGIGMMFLSLVLIFKVNLLITNIIGVLMVLLGLYEIFSGILKILYSLKIQKRKIKNRKVEVFKTITGITELIALLVVMLQLVEESL